MATCHDVAQYFLSKVNPEFGDQISNLKLQKLVYYAQGFALAVLGQPLFDEPIEAWEHGPVVPELYHAYKQNGSEPVPPAEFPEAGTVFSPEQLDLLDQVNEVYGQFSAWKLRNMTHEEAPWLGAIDNLSTVITQESMTDYFKTLVV